MSAVIKNNFLHANTIYSYIVKLLQDSKIQPNV